MQDCAIEHAICNAKGDAINLSTRGKRKPEKDINSNTPKRNMSAYLLYQQNIM
jgi:hypothetical protein